MAASLKGEAGLRLLPALLDELAQSNPDRILYSIPKNSDPVNGFQDITAKDFAQAVNRCAWHIVDNFGRGYDFPTMTYMGPQDLVYLILILACNKTGYKLLLSSLRNSLQENLRLFEETDCNTFLIPSRSPLPIIKKVLAARDMRQLEVPTMKEFFGNLAHSYPTKPYAYTATFKEAMLDPFVVLHTSGSTGSPKPITQTHATITPFDAFANSSHPLPYPAMCKGKRVYVTFPLFHCGGIHMALPGPIYCDFTAVLGPYPPSAEMVDRVHVHGNVQCTSLAALTLVDLAKTPSYLENLGRLEHVAYGGSPCPRAVGDLVSTKTRLKTSFGTTEAGAMPTMLCEPEDWAYIKMSPLLGIEYHHVSEDLYEQVIVRDPKLQRYQGVFGTFPNLQEWPMKDLYTPHPTKTDLWLYEGRSDDVIVYSTGEKLNPLAAEGIIGAHPAIKGVLIGGRGRMQSSLLVEPREGAANETERLQLLETIWPLVKKVNTEISAHARIHRHMILFTRIEEPMLRTGKGTIQRQATLTLYTDELDALYKASEDPSSVPGRSTYRSDARVEDVIYDIVDRSIDIELATTGPETNLFEQGLDSLQVVQIVRETNKYLSMRDNSLLTTRNVYANPTIHGLMSVVASLAEGKPNVSIQTAAGDVRKLRELYDANVESLPLTASKTEQGPLKELVFLLTGSTGSLGSYVLDLIAGDPRVSKVYCLTRGPERQERQRISLEKKGLKQLPGGVVEFLDTDFSKVQLGLPTAKYTELLGAVTNIIHGAWRVDFNLTLESFSHQIAAVTSLIHFSVESALGASIFFLSSIGAVANWPLVSGKSGSAPEEIFNDWRIPDGSGYAQSKFIAERLLDTAAQQTGIPVSLCRIGQIAGPTMQEGAWPKQEWLPSLVASSKYMGKLPSSLGRLGVIDWVPVDLVACCVLELAMESRDTPSGGAAVYHVVNPQKSTWKDLLPTLEKTLDIPETVPLEAWVDALRDTTSMGDLAQNPAWKLLDFFESLVNNDEKAPFVQLDTTNTEKLSITMERLEPVRDVWLQNWIRQWGF